MTVASYQKEVKITQALSSVDLARWVDHLKPPDLYASHCRFTQYACHCARRGRLQEADDALMTAHKMDKMEFAKTNEPPRDTCAIMFLVFIISALCGPKAGLVFVLPFLQDIAPDGTFTMLTYGADGSGYRALTLHLHAGIVVIPGVTMGSVIALTSAECGGV